MGVTQAIMDRIEELKQGRRFFEAESGVPELEGWRRGKARLRVDEIDREIEALTRLLNTPLKATP